MLYVNMISTIIGKDVQLKSSSTGQHTETKRINSIQMYQNGSWNNTGLLFPFERYMITHCPGHSVWWEWLVLSQVAEAWAYVAAELTGEAIDPEVPTLQLSAPCTALAATVLVGQTVTAW
jgi:hypothetical protein